MLFCCTEKNSDDLILKRMTKPLNMKEGHTSTSLLISTIFGFGVIDNTIQMI